MTTKFITDGGKITARNATQPRRPELSGEDRRKRAARRTSGFLRDVLINVSLETLIHVGRLARVTREISPRTMIPEEKPRSTLTRSRLTETLYTICFVHSTKLCTFYKGSVYREFLEREVAL